MPPVFDEVRGRIAARVSGRAMMRIGGIVFGIDISEFRYRFSE
jgi:hypothetical protein